MDFSFKIEGRDKIEDAAQAQQPAESATQSAQPRPHRQDHNGRKIASLLDAALGVAQRRGMF